MKRVPPELDSLMWTLAEEGNERAIDEFGVRHAEHRGELLRRIAMVKGLRGEKKRTTEPIKAIPRFVPKEAKSHGPTYVVTSLVLAAVAALTFAVTTLMTPPPHLHPKDYKPGRSAPVVERTAEPIVPKNEPAPKVDPIVPERKEADTDTILTPVTLRADHAPLMMVMELMAQKCNIRIDPAPGMPNPTVEVDYKDMNAMEMLRDLGKQYGFTPLNQHDGSILVVPAVDRGQPALDGSETQRVNRQKIAG